MHSLSLILISWIILASSIGCAQENPTPGRNANPDTGSRGAVSGDVRADHDPNCIPPPPTRINKVIHNMPEYDTVTVELIRCLPDSLLDYVMNHYASMTLEELRRKQIKRGGYIEQREALLRLPRGLRMIWTTWWLEAEASNGGFDQYFSNTSGEFTDEALAGLRLIGATKTAELAEKAYLLWKAEQQRIERVGEAGYEGPDREHYFDLEEALSRTFYKTARWEGATEDIELLRIAYIRAHPLECIKE